MPFAVALGEGAYAMWREKLALIQHETQDTRQLLATGDGQQPPHAAGGLDHLDVFAEIRSIVDKPLQAAFEACTPGKRPRRGPVD
jgi:hypothetical protein